MPLLMTLADNVAIPDLIWNASSEIYAEFMILCGEYLTYFVYTLLIFFLAQLLFACYKLGTVHAGATSTSSEEEPHIECPDHYRNLQAAMGLTDNYWLYHEICVSPPPFFPFFL